MAKRKKFDPNTPVGMARYDLKLAQRREETMPSKEHTTARKEAEKSLLRAKAIRDKRGHPNVGTD